MNKTQQKQQYENIKRIKLMIKDGVETTFAERNIVKIYEKRMAKKKKL